MSYPSRYLDTTFADLAASPTEQRKRMSDKLRQVRNSSDENKQGGPTPTKQLRNHLTNILTGTRTFEETLETVSGYGNKTLAKNLSVSLINSMEFLGEFRGTFIRPQDYGRYPVPVRPFLINLFSHATLLDDLGSVEFVIYNTNKVHIDPHYWPAFNALARYTYDLAGINDSRVILFDATKRVAMSADPDYLAMEDLLEQRHKTWKKLIGDRRIEDPLNIDEWRRLQQ